MRGVPGSLTCLRWLLEAVDVLAAEPDEQIDWIDSGRPDQLALTFDEVFSLLPMMRTEHHVVLPPEVLALLQTLHDMLEAMGGPADAELWTSEALRTSGRWADVRQVAREANGLLSPPSGP